MTKQTIAYLSSHLSKLRVIHSSFILQAKDRATQNFFIGTLFIQPVIMTMLSVGIYRHGGQADFGLYAVIGAGMIGIWNANLWTSGRIVDNERRAGTLSFLLATPTSLPVILLGKSLSNAVVSLLAMGIALATGLIAFQLPLGIKDPLAFLVGLILTLVAMTCLGLVLGSFFVLTRNAGQFIQVANYPIFILSGLTFPLTLLPTWVRPLSYSLAPMWGNQVLNRAAGIFAESVWPGYVLLIGLSVLYLIIARPLFRLIERLVRETGSLEVW